MTGNIAIGRMRIPALSFSSRYDKSRPQSGRSLSASDHLLSNCRGSDLRWDRPESEDPVLRNVNVWPSADLIWAWQRLQRT
jgi:hypothetical protein